MGDLFAAFGINWKLLVIQAVNFGVLLTALWYFLYTPVLTMIDERKKKIAEGVRNADEAEKRLRDVAAEKDTIIAQARRDATDIAAKTKQKAVEDAALLKAEAEARAAKTLQDAQAQAHEAKAQAQRELQKEVAQSALLAAEKILHDKSMRA